MSNKYAEDGVDTRVGDAASSSTGALIKSTWQNNPRVRVIDLSNGLFRGPRAYRIHLPFWGFETQAADGIGTKTMLLDGVGAYRHAARDLIAMTCSDITRYGGLPVMLSNVLSVRTLGDQDKNVDQEYHELIEGLVEAARLSKIVIFTGETAATGVGTGSENPNARYPFNWEAVATGVYHPDLMIRGEGIQPGDFVIALKEDGFRSNGISSVRTAFAMHYGADFYSLPEAQEDLRAATTPSVLYDDFLASINGWSSSQLKPLVRVKLLAHLTGGGIGKFVEQLAPSGLSAILSDLFEPPDIMRKCAEWRGVADYEFYETWNGGQGMLAVMAEEELSRFLEHAKSFSVRAQVAGRIHKSSGAPTVRIHSKFKGGELTYS